MPPWPPDSIYQNYAHERTLNQNEIDLILEWANIGSPEGDPNLAPLNLFTIMKVYCQILI